MNKIVYVPPPNDVIQRFAREACRRLSQSDDGYADPEVARGLSGFLCSVAKAVANNLNRESEEVDNANE